MTSQCAIYTKEYQDFLRVQKEELEAKNETIFQLTKTFERNSDNRSILLSIGCGLWVEKNKYEAILFANRQLSRYKIALERISRLISNSERSSNDFCTANSSIRDKNGDEDLPTVEILEQIDDEGNIISTQIKEANLEGTSRFENSQHDVSTDRGIMFANQARHLTKENMLKDPTIYPLMKTCDGSELNELFTEMGIVENCSKSNTKYSKLASPAGDPSTMKESLPSRNSSENICTAENYRSDSIYELELIAKQTNGSDSELDVPSEFDYDYELTSSNEQQSDSDDEFLNNSHASLVPGNNQLQSRIWSEVQALRVKHHESSSSIKLIGKKVRFKDTVDIKEVDNVTEELKSIKHEKQSFSKFKENRLGMLYEQNTSRKSQHTDSAQNKGIQSISGSNIDEPNIISLQQSRKKVTNSNAEKSTDSDPQEIEDFAKLQKKVSRENHMKKTSRFRQMVNQNPQQKPSGSSLKIGGFSPKRLADLASNDQSDSIGHVSEMRTNSDYLDIMVRDYHSGTYDDDLTIVGPTITNLHDFSQLNVPMNTSNKIEETSLEDNENLAESPEYSQCDSDEEVMLMNIIEKEYDGRNENLNDDQIHQANSIEQNILNREVQENYYRLKKKMLWGNDQFVQSEESRKSD